MDIRQPSSGGLASTGVKELKPLARGAAGWPPAGAFSETVQGRMGQNMALLTSGTLWLVALSPLPGGQAINNVTFVSGTTPAGTPTNQWACLVDQALNVLRKSADQTSGAWAANTAKTFALSSAYTPADDIAVYAGLVVVAATPPSLQGRDIIAGAGVGPIAPKLAGSSTAGLTDPASLGATAAALGGNPNQLPYAYVT